MKIIRQLLAVLLLLFFVIACNQETKKSDNATNSDSKVQEMRLTELKQSERPPPPPKQETSVDYSQISIVPDYEVVKTNKDGDGVTDELEKPLENKNEFNTEDYDNIIENKFLTATKNPLSTFSIVPSFRNADNALTICRSKFLFFLWLNGTSNPS